MILIFLLNKSAATYQINTNSVSTFEVEVSSIKDKSEVDKIIVKDNLTNC